jgi:hypothetical protein
MTIFCLDILLHGIIPAVTGGFYYDLYTTPLANTVHIYLWICFMILPLILYLVGADRLSVRQQPSLLQFAPTSLLSFYIYPLIIAILFSIIKLINYRLHKFFDLAVRYDEAAIDSARPATDANDDLEEEPKLRHSRTNIDAPSAETQ